jgi:hypothetical protein
VNWGFQIAGSFRGLAQGWLLLAPAEWGEAEATAPPLPDQVCAGTVVPGEGVEPSYVSRRSGF